MPSTNSEERPPVLSVGAVTGGTRASREWKLAVRSLTQRIMAARDQYDSPLCVNVIYYIPGEVHRADFAGVRTGRYTDATHWLVVQAALPDEPLSDADREVREILEIAVESAEQFACRRGIADRLIGLRNLLTAVR